MNNGLTTQKTLSGKSLGRSTPFERISGDLFGDFSELFDVFLGGRLAPDSSIRGAAEQLASVHSSARSPLQGAFMPPVNVAEEEDHYLVEAELPGIPMSEVEVTLEGRELRIRGEKRLEENEEKKQFHRKESSYGKFERGLRFPTDVDPDGVEAKSQDGVLRITVKKSEKAKPRKIQIT